MGGVGGDVPEGFTRRPIPRPSAKRNIFYDDEEQSLYQQSLEAKPSDELDTLNSVLCDETPQEWSEISKRGFFRHSSDYERESLKYSVKQYVFY